MGEGTQALPAEKQIEAVSKKLMELNPGFDGKVTGWYQMQGEPTIENGVVTEIGFFTDHVTDISPVRALSGLKFLGCPGNKLTDLTPLIEMHLEHLICYGNPITDITPLKNLPLKYLHLSSTMVADISPLAGMKLEWLRLSGTKINDIALLKGMPLQHLTVDGTQVADLSPLKGMPLTSLNCRQTPVSDLSPLAGMPLTGLDCCPSQVTDLSPLAGMKLVEFRFVPKNITKGIDTVRQMQSLKDIWVGWGEHDHYSPEDFWKKYDAGEFGTPTPPAKPITTYKDPAFKKWTKEVAAMPAEEQVEAVSKKLVELNPGFDGNVTGIHGSRTPKIESGVVTEFGFITDKVSDISPVRALVGLKVLKCVGGGPDKGRLSDLSPLTGMALTGLWFGSTQVSDVSPLQGMQLTMIAFTPKNITKGIEVIRQMKSLKTIGLRGDRDKFPPDEFWRKYDAGEFNK